MLDIQHIVAAMKPVDLNGYNKYVKGAYPTGNGTYLLHLDGNAVPIDCQRFDTKGHILGYYIAGEVIREASSGSEEKLAAIVLANKVLDKPWTDPDRDEAVLARQFLRALERLGEHTGNGPKFEGSP